MFCIQGIKKYIDLYDLGSQTTAERREILKEQKENVLEKNHVLQTVPDFLDRKIEVYNKRIESDIEIRRQKNERNNKFEKIRFCVHAFTHGGR